MQQPDTAVTFVDYSNMTVGATTFSIPEAPRPIDGGMPGRGVLCQGNITQGVKAGLNILAGATPITFSGSYRLSFDAWINVPFPLPSGSTEQFVWGVGVDGIAPIEVRGNRGTGCFGIWGWLCGENGYSTEDADINNGDVELADLGDLQPGESIPFNEAFDQNTVGGINGAAANTWVRVDVDVTATDVTVYFNGYPFFSEVVTAPAGFAMIGYEDPFNSLGSSPDEQWGLLDNFRVIPLGLCGAPGTAILQGTTTGGEILNGAAPPAVAAPMTVRLRGGPVSSLAFLAVGQPSPITLTVPLSPTCSIDVEMVTLINLIGVSTTVAGGAQYSFNVPNDVTLCGAQLGWQYLWLSTTNPGCFEITEGLTTTIGS
ncbi:MAG TPA: hypothetical protein ENI87_13785 [bacterium]|nr:hypothetical protein [bacterium]